MRRTVFGVGFLVAALSLACGTPAAEDVGESGADLDGSRYDVVGDIALGATRTIHLDGTNARKTLRLVLGAKRGVAAHVVTTDGRYEPQVRIVDEDGHQLAPPRARAYFANGSSPKTVYLAVESSPRVALDVRLEAAPTACGGACNDFSTMICSESTGSCGACSASFGSGGPGACPSEAPACGPHGQCATCAGDFGSGSDYACGAAAPHCEATVFASEIRSVVRCRAFDDTRDFTPPPQLRERELAVDMTCTADGAPLAIGPRIRFWAGPTYPEPTVSAQDHRPQAYVRGVTLAGHDVDALDHDAALRTQSVGAQGWDRWLVSELADAATDCGPASAWDAYHSLSVPLPFASPDKVIVGGKCTFEVDGPQMRVRIASGRLVCSGSVK